MDSCVANFRAPTTLSVQILSRRHRVTSPHTSFIEMCVWSPHLYAFRTSPSRQAHLTQTWCKACTLFEDPHVGPCSHPQCLGPGCRLGASHGNGLTVNLRPHRISTDGRRVRRFTRGQCPFLNYSQVYNSFSSAVMATHCLFEAHSFAMHAKNPSFGIRTWRPIFQTEIERFLVRS